MTEMDKDLEFLSKLPSEKLNGLVETIIHDEDGTIRLNETLTVTTAFESHYPDHNKYVEDIIDEVLCFGGHFIMNILRGFRGPCYRKVISNICRKFNICDDKNKTIEFYEKKILENMARFIQSEDVTAQCVLHIARLRDGQNKTVA